MYSDGESVRIWDLDMKELGVGKIQRVDSREIPHEVLERLGFYFRKPYVSMGRITMPDGTIHWACDVWVCSLNDVPPVTGGTRKVGEAAKSRSAPKQAPPKKTTGGRFGKISIEELKQKVG